MIFGQREREKVLLVDGNNILSRATYAYDARSPNADGDQHVAGSVMLWLNSLRRYVRSEKPDRIAICFDPPTRPSWRAEIMPSYKADRTTAKAGPPVAYAVVLAHTLGVETREHSQAEADDLVAGLAQVHSRLGHEVVIVSADKDLLQCLRDEHVSILRPGIQPEWWGARQVEERYGVPPAMMAAYQALVGDSSDGVPGVRGIGPKRAVAILSSEGSQGVVESPQITKRKARGAFEQALSVVSLPGSPERYEEALHPVPPLVGCRDAFGVTALGVLDALGLDDEAELLRAGRIWE